MKKFNLTLLVSFIFSVFSQAQTANVGFHAGMSFSTTSMKIDLGDFGTEKLDTKPLAGFNTGVFLDILLSKHLTLQPGVNYVQKGFVYKEEMAGLEEKQVMRLHYLELPVNLVYYHQPGQKGFFAGGGVGFGFAVGGKVKYTSDGEETEEKVEIGVNEDQLKGGDIGINLMTGYAWNNGLFVGLSANLGLINLSNETEVKMTNNYFGVKIGYLLRQKR